MFDTSIGLWLILNKHFIAKPACATSLPRFVSDTIYKMGAPLIGFFRCDGSASHAGSRWPRTAILAFVTDSTYADRLCMHVVRSRSVRHAYIGMHCSFPEWHAHMAVQVRMMQCAHTENRMSGTVSLLHVLIIIRGPCHICIAGIVSHAHGP